VNPYIIALLGAVAIVGTILAIVAMFGKAKASAGQAGAHEDVLEEGAKKRIAAEEAAIEERKRLEEKYK